MGYFDTPTDIKRPELPRLKAWSFSRMQDHEKCAHMVYLKAIEKHPEPPNPYTARGNEIHDALERYIRGETEDLPEINFDPALINHLRDEYQEARVLVERQWGFTKNWTPCEWMAKDVWARVKLDVLHFTGPYTAEVIDWKTGKFKGNEVKHADQGLQYAVAAMTQYPQLEEVTVFFAYVDHNHQSAARTVKKAMLETYRASITQRALTVTEDTLFRPRPGKWNCRWCSMKEFCDYRYEE